MRRAFRPALIVFLLAGCQLPPERLPVQPIPENGQAPEYSDVVTRARLHAMTAIEAFYVNKWTDIEESARALEKTAALLPRATDVPAAQKDKLDKHATDLAREANQLREAAKAKDTKKTIDILQAILVKVREMRPEG